jgi:hypothetical protein
MDGKFCHYRAVDMHYNRKVFCSWFQGACLAGCIVNVTPPGPVLPCMQVPSDKFLPMVGCMHNFLSAWRSVALMASHTWFHLKCL